MSASIPTKSVNNLKKAPDAPRRFKSAYMFFSTSEHKKIRTQFAARGESCTTPQVARMVSKAWKSMSNTEQAYWHNLAAQDKARFSIEMAQYKGPLKIDKNLHRKKDPKAPKRPISAFLAYSNAKRNQVRKQNPGLSTTELSTILSRMWKEADPVEKKVFLDQDAKLRVQYKKKLEIYKKAKATDQKAREEKAVQEALGKGLCQQLGVPERPKTVDAAVKEKNATTVANYEEQQQEENNVMAKSVAKSVVKSKKVRKEKQQVLSKESNVPVQGHHDQKSYLTDNELFRTNPLFQTNQLMGGEMEQLFDHNNHQDAHAIVHDIVQEIDMEDSDQEDWEPLPLFPFTVEGGNEETEDTERFTTDSPVPDANSFYSGFNFRPESSHSNMDVNPTQFVAASSSSASTASSYTSTSGSAKSYKKDAQATAAIVTPYLDRPTFRWGGEFTPRINANIYTPNFHHTLPYPFFQGNFHRSPWMGFQPRIRNTGTADFQFVPNTPQQNTEAVENHLEK